MILLPLLAACATPGATSGAPAASTTFASTQAPSEIRDCVALQTLRAGVSEGSFEFTLDGGFSYRSNADRAVIAQVAEAEGGSRITLGSAGPRLSGIIRGCASPSA
ncbi:MAG: hypothetical protein KY449_03540 [Proteobacteria bacterium]|nr:hypothetical protein [Pseudomonadota bacterium]